MRPKKPILLYCADAELLSATAFALRLHPYEVIAIEGCADATLLAGGSGAVFACCVLIHAQQGDLAGRLVQRRRRVFVVGCAGGWRAAAAVLFEQSCLSGYPPPRREARKDLAPTLSARAHGGGGLGTDFDLDGGLIRQLAFGGNNTAGPIDVATAANACASASGRMDFETETFIAHSLSADGFDASEDGTGRGVPLIAGTLSTRNGASSDRDLSNSFALPPVAFNLRGRDGGALPEVSESASLRASAGGSTNSYIAFSAKDRVAVMFYGWTKVDAFFEAWRSAGFPSRSGLSNKSIARQLSRHAPEPIRSRISQQVRAERSLHTSARTPRTSPPNSSGPLRFCRSPPSPATRTSRRSIG